MPRHKDADRDQVLSETRQLLLEAAAQEFARKGYAGANVNHISRAAGFAKGTVYNYFDSKRALMRAIIDETAGAHLDFIAGSIRQEQDAGRRLACFFEAGFAFVTEHLARARVMVNTLYGPDTEFKEYVYAAYRPMFQLVNREIVVAGTVQGLFRAVDPEAMTVLLMTIYLGTGSQVDEQGRNWLDPRLVADFAWHALRRQQTEHEED
jgi:AcrR family transcriptional regulator